MKKKVFLAFPVLLLGLASFLFSCSSENNDDKSLTDLKEKSLTFEQFFDNVSKKNFNLGEDDVLEIKYQWNAQDKTIKVLSSQETEMNFGIALDVASEMKNRSHLSAYRTEDGKEYSVKCVKADGSQVTVKCSGKYDCGKKVYDCLEAGGCATICSMSMYYHPGTKSFYVENSL